MLKGPSKRMNEKKRERESKANFCQFLRKKCTFQTKLKSQIINVGTNESRFKMERGQSSHFRLVLNI